MFFALFMIAVYRQHEKTLEHCGFLDSVFWKTIFYVFLACISLGNYKFWSCWITCIFAGGVAVLNLIRICGDKEKVHENETLK